MTSILLDREIEALKEENERLRFGMTALLKELDEYRVKLGIKEKIDEKKQSTVNRYSPEEILELADLLQKKVVDLPLSVRTINGLHISDIETLYDVIKTGRSKLLKSRGCTPKVVNEIDQFIKDSGLSWDAYIDDIIEMGAIETLSKD
ncbi:MAG: hypothetical protein IK075_06010 [Prevotella sp.]|nr:hypothetical protein [Prevotella sp.]